MDMYPFPSVKPGRICWALCFEDPGAEPVEAGNQDLLVSRIDSPQGVQAQVIFIYFKAFTRATLSAAIGLIELQQTEDGHLRYGKEPIFRRHLPEITRYIESRELPSLINLPYCWLPEEREGVSVMFARETSRPEPFLRAAPGVALGYECTCSFSGVRQ